MANEFKHKSVGSQITQTEYEHTDGTGHIFDSQAAGDIPYASSTTVLSRLGIGTAGKLLQVNSGATAPEWTAAITGATSILNAALVIGRDADNDIDFATDNTILFRADGADQIKLTNGALLPVADDDIDLGSSSLQFKDGHFDGTVEADAITVGGTAVLTGGAETAITSILNASLVLGRDADNDIDFGTDNNIIFRAGAADQIKLIDGVLQPVTDSDVDLGTTGVRFKDAFIDTVTTTGNVTVGGDLTITGDDLVMGTNTSGMLLIADGTNFNPTAVTSLSAISSIDNTDTFLAIDATDGALKKVARSVVVSGLATSSALSNVVEDTSPHLGGNLDVQTNSIITDASNRNIKLQVHGTGKVEVRGNTDSSGTNPGTIILNCEQNTHGQTIKAQAHSAAVTNTLTLPAGASSTLVSLVSTDTLTNKTLTSPKINEDVALTSTATELNLLDGVSGLVQADLTKLAAVDSTAAELNVLDGITAVVGELNALDIGSTAVGTAVASKAVILDSNKDYTGMRNLTISGEIDAATGDYSGAVDVAGAFTTSTIVASGIVKTDDTTNATSTTDGSLQTDGGLSVALDGIFGDDVTLITDDAVLNLGVGSDVKLTHDGTTGGTLSGTPMVLETLGGGALVNDTHGGVVIEFLAGESLAVGDWVYMSTVDGRVSKADSNDTGDDGHYPAIGVAVSAQGSAGSAVKVLTHGVYNDSDGFGGSDLTEGKQLFLSETAGTLTSTAPSDDGDIVQVCGIAIGPRDVLVSPSLDIIERAA